MFLKHNEREVQIIEYQIHWEWESSLENGKRQAQSRLH